MIRFAVQLRRAAQKRKLREHTIKARKIAGVLKDPADTQNKGRFIMKRYAILGCHDNVIL